MLSSHLPTRCLLPLLAIAAATLAGVQSAAAEDDAKKEPSKFEKAIDGLDKEDGLWTTYHDEKTLLVELKSSQLSKEYIVIPSIARGISRGNVLGGMSWDFGGDAIWTFKKVGDAIHVIQRNVRFTADKGSPEADAVKLAYSDSVLYSLPIKADTSGGHLVDMTRVFMSDDQQVGRQIGSGFRFQPDRSTWAKVAGYPKNLELQVAAVYSGAGSFDTVANSRGVQVHVHYSISELPSTGYTPRKADDRVGYFLSVQKDFSNRDDEEHFVRYINRWNLKKKAPSIDLSPPEEPIVFYIEKTVPVALRPTVRAGILEWNKAFRAIGFDGAIEVRQQRDDDTWSPEDVRYNTFRWITADAGFAMGPSRVNPRTGQILDADIIFDASFLDSWRREYETFSDETARGLLPAWPDRLSREEGFGPLPAETIGQMFGGHSHSGHSCRMCAGMQHQFGYGAAMMAGQGNLAASSGDGKIAGLPKEFVHQGLKEVVMHEVGHTLGLRHNFKASAWKSLDEVTGEKDPNVPIVASVMDYAPANITGDAETQGLYYTQTLGPYDMWAIEYGYKQFESKSKEKDGLAEIAARSSEPQLAYLTDEDTRMTGSDPLSNLFDVGSDPIAYARRQMDLSASLLDGVVDRTVDEGEGYQRARQAFGLLLSEYFRSGLFATRFLGGVSTSRDHQGEDARAPFAIVPAAQQREAMALISEKVFNAPAIDGAMLNKLPASHWSHWGTFRPMRGDYAIHDTIARMQRLFVFELTDPTMLDRLLDNDFKTPEGEDRYTLPEHFRLITDGTFGEVLSAAKPTKNATKNAKKGENAGEKKREKEDAQAGELAIDSFRRGLQRITLKELARLVQRPFGYPDDARTLARLQLVRIQRATNAVLKSDLEMDDLTRAHLLDTNQRIKQVLNADLSVQSID